MFMEEKQDYKDYDKKTNRSLTPKKKRQQRTKNEKKKEKKNETLMHRPSCTSCPPYWYLQTQIPRLNKHGSLPPLPPVAFSTFFYKHMGYSIKNGRNCAIFNKVDNFGGYIYILSEFRRTTVLFGHIGQGSRAGLRLERRALRIT